MSSALTPQAFGFTRMKTQRFAIGLTVLNLFVLMFLLFRNDSSANSQIAPVLRGRAIEIVDDRGRVRAMIKVLPPSPDIKLSDGTT
jgi:hypothetical protein